MSVMARLWFKALAAGAKFVWQNQLILAAITLDMFAVLFGPVISVVGGGIGTILVVIATAMIWSGIRRLGALQEYKVSE